MKIVAFVAGLGIAATSQAQTLYQSRPPNLTAMMRDGRTLALMPNDTELHGIDTSEGYVRLYPGSCIAAPPAHCQGQDQQPMKEVK